MIKIENISLKFGGDGEMKYSKFIKLVKELGFNIHDYGYLLAVLGDNGDNVLLIDKEVECVINNHLAEFKSLPKSKRDTLYELAVELSSTPLKEREGEKKYRLRIPFMGDTGYLNIAKANDNYYVSTKAKTSHFRDTFTEQEVAKLKQNHNLDSFVKEEAKEGE